MIRRQMIRLQQNNPRERLLARLILARRDMNDALDYVEFVLQKISSSRDILLEPLSCAAVISYSRPFVGSRRYPALPSRYSSFESQKDLEFHKNVIEFRNNSVAHRDSELNPVFIIPKGAEVSWGDGKYKASLCSPGDSIALRTLSLRVFPRFKGICVFQLERLGDHILSEKDLIFAGAENARSSAPITGDAKVFLP